MPHTLHRRRPAMGTWFEAWLVGDDEEHLAPVADAAFDEIERVERLLSRFDPRSEVSRLNREAASRAVRVDYELITVLHACRSGWERTGGAFDPTAGTVRAGFADVVIDEERRTVRFVTEGLALDFGGFGKGYALDRAAGVLRWFGVRSALLHGGTSSVLALGLDAEGQGWSVALRDRFGQGLSDNIIGSSCGRDDGDRNRSPSPLVREGWGGGPKLGVRSAKLSAALLVAPTPLPNPPPQGGRGQELRRLSDRALSCSSVFAPNRSSSDLIDPRTGHPLSSAAACIVLDHSAAEAEILSTALLVMGRTRATLYSEREAREGLGIAWIEPNSAPEWLTGGP